MAVVRRGRLRAGLLEVDLVAAHHREWRSAPSSSSSSSPTSRSRAAWRRPIGSSRASTSSSSSTRRRCACCVRVGVVVALVVSVFVGLAMSSEWLTVQTRAARRLVGDRRSAVRPRLLVLRLQAAVLAPALLASSSGRWSRRSSMPWQAHVALGGLVVQRRPQGQADDDERPAVPSPLRFSAVPRRRPTLELRPSGVAVAHLSAILGLIFAGRRPGLAVPRLEPALLVGRRGRRRRLHRHARASARHPRHVRHRARPGGHAVRQRVASPLALAAVRRRPAGSWS